MNKELKRAQARKAEPARVALVQGMAAAQEEDGAEKALPKLKEALAANPKSARIHFRLALAYLALKDDANAAKELKETLRLSPQHERARMTMESLAPPAAAEQK
jgi:Tfp pilus assembly protein PilF